VNPTGSASGFPIPFTMAFQPIVDAGAGAPFAYEALVRGQAGEGAAPILAAVTPDNRDDFDRGCRTCAMQLAARLGLMKSDAALSINMLPQTTSDPESRIEQSIEAAETAGVPAGRIIFELTEHERVDVRQLQRIIETHRRHGFRTAIDDFGAGHSGLSLLAAFQPDIVKLDMALVRGIDQSRVRRVIVSAVARMCADLDIVLVAEGIETAQECAALQDLGVTLMQGYFFARPAVEAFPDPVLPRAKPLSRAGAF